MTSIKYPSRLVYIKTILVIAAFASAFLSVWNYAQADSFNAAVNYPVGTTPSDLLLNDLNGDGFKDLVTINQGSNNVSILINNGNGTFAAAVDYGVGATPTRGFAADFDNDNDKDLAILGATNTTVSVLLNNGNGTFAAATNYSLSTSSLPNWIAGANLRQNGRIDIVVSNNSNSGFPVGRAIHVLLNNGDGTFAAQADYDPSGRPRRFSLANLNNDAYPD